MDKFFRTSNSVLEERLDPNFYQPSLVSNDELIKSKGWVELNTFYRSSGIGNTSGVERYYSDSADSIPYISGKAIKCFNIDFDGCHRVTADSHKNELAKSTLKSGDVLVIRKGDMGNACVVPSDVNEANCSSEVIYLKMKDSSEPYFLVSYLNCEQGQKAFKRLGRGTIIPGVSLLDVPFLPVPQFSETAQKYIGDKVRQAEQLRAWAKSTQDSIKSYFDGLMPDLDLQSRVYKAPIKSLDNRMDATYYLPKYVELDSYFATKSHNVRPLAHYIENKISGPAIPSNQFYTSGTGVLVLQTKDIRENYIDKKTCSKITKSSADELTRFQVGAGTLLMGMSGTIGRTALVFDPNEKYIINQRVAALILNDIKISGYLCAYLNHSFGRHQLQRQSVGGVQANIGLSEISSTKILVADRGYAEKISELFIESLIAQKLSTTLTDAAKTLVEALIEGQLTEQQLIQAQQTLDDGDNSLDQAILSKLSSEGYAIEGAKPLFSDINELYRLLESVAQTEAEK